MTRGAAAIAVAAAPVFRSLRLMGSIGAQRNTFCRLSSLMIVTSSGTLEARGPETEPTICFRHHDHHRRAWRLDDRRHAGVQIAARGAAGRIRQRRESVLVLADADASRL